MSRGMRSLPGLSTRDFWILLKSVKTKKAMQFFMRGKNMNHIEDNIEKTICNRFYDALKENKAVRVFHVTGPGRYSKAPEMVSA